MQVVCEPPPEAWDVLGSNMSPTTPSWRTEATPSGPSEGTERQGDTYFDTRWSHTAKYLRELASRKAAQAEQIRRQRSSILVFNDDDRSALVSSPFNASSYTLDLDGANIPLTSGAGSLFPPHSPTSPLHYAALVGGRVYGARYPHGAKSPAAALLSSGLSAPGASSSLDTLLESVLQRSTAVSSKLVQSIALPNEREKLESSHGGPPAARKHGEAHGPGHGHRRGGSQAAAGSPGGSKGDHVGRHTPTPEDSSPRNYLQRSHTSSEAQLDDLSMQQSPQEQQQQQHPYKSLAEPTDLPQLNSQPLPQLHLPRNPLVPAARPPTRGSMPGSPRISSVSPSLASPVGWSGAFGSTIPASPSRPPAPSPLTVDMSGLFSPSTAAAAAAMTAALEQSSGPAAGSSTDAARGHAHPEYVDTPELLTTEDSAAMTRQAPGAGSSGDEGRIFRGSATGEVDSAFRRHPPRRRKTPTTSASFHLPAPPRHGVPHEQPAPHSSTAARRRSLSRSSDGGGGRPLVTMRPNSPVQIPGSRHAAPSRDGPNSCPAAATTTTGASTPVHLPQLGGSSGGTGGRPTSSCNSGGGAGAGAPVGGPDTRRSSFCHSTASRHGTPGLVSSRRSHDSGGDGAGLMSPVGEESYASGIGGVARRASLLRAPPKGQPSSGAGSFGLMSPTAQSSWAKSTTTRELVYTRF